MNLQHARIAALCEQLKLDRLPAEWPSVAQATIDNSGTHADFLEAGRVRQGGVNSDPAFRSGNMSVKR
ncbi:hypothetical protein WKI72_16945 [Candidatus Erwinia dacicola]